MSHPILITGAGGGPRDQLDASSPVSCSSREFPFVPSSINWMPGPRSSANKVRKSSRAISSIQPQSRRQ
jgi:hypothetical protein